MIDSRGLWGTMVRLVWPAFIAACSWPLPSATSDASPTDAIGCTGELTIINSYSRRARCPRGRPSIDDWGFPECSDASYVADLVNQAGHVFPKDYGDTRWKAAASWWRAALDAQASCPNARLTTSTVPSAGDVAWWPDHVAYVVHAYPDNDVDVCEYGGEKVGDFGCRRHVSAQGYIRFDSPSFTRGEVRGGHIEESSLVFASWTPKALEPCQSREAEDYWGMRGMDWAGEVSTLPFMNDREGDAGKSRCTVGKIHLGGWNEGALVEYRVFFPDAAAYVLNVIGMPSVPPATRVDVFIDRRYAGFVEWKDGPSQCDVPDTGASQRIAIEGYTGAHVVAFQFSDQQDHVAEGWCNRTFLFDRFEMTRDTTLTRPSSIPTIGR